MERFHRSLKNALRCAASAYKAWTRNLPWVLLGLPNAPRSDTATLAAEVMYGTPLRVPGLCFKQELVSLDTATRQLQLARENVARYLPPQLDRKKFRHSPFVAKGLRECELVYVRNDSLAKPSLAPRYSGPFEVIRKDWGNNTFVLNLEDRQDIVALGRLKAATTV